MEFATTQLLIGIVIGCSFVFSLINIQSTDNHSNYIRTLDTEDKLHGKIDRLISKLTENNSTNKEADLTDFKDIPEESRISYKKGYVKESDITKNKVLPGLSGISEKKREKEVRVLNWVMTSPTNLKGPAQGVKDTWGGRAEKVLYMSTEQNDTFPTIKLNVTEGYDHLTAKTMHAFRYCYEHYFNDFDWFMKTDDDTYVIVENVKYFLSKYSPSEPIAFGHLFSPYMKQGYFSGGAGYVLSKAALHLLYDKGNDPDLCQQDKGAEDMEIGHCFEAIGIKTGNSSDANGRSRFHALMPDMHLMSMSGSKHLDWMFRYDSNRARHGKDTISNYAISFHYVTPAEMLRTHFLLYHLRPFGLAKAEDVSNIPQENIFHRKGVNDKFNAYLNCTDDNSCEEVLNGKRRDDLFDVETEK